MSSITVTSICWKDITIVSHLPFFLKRIVLKLWILNKIWHIENKNKGKIMCSPLSKFAMASHILGDLFLPSIYSLQPNLLPSMINCKMISIYGPSVNQTRSLLSCKKALPACTYKKIFSALCKQHRPTTKIHQR